MAIIKALAEYSPYTRDEIENAYQSCGKSFDMTIEVIDEACAYNTSLVGGIRKLKEKEEKMTDITYLNNGDKIILSKREGWKNA